MDNHKTLALIGDGDVKYADVVSGDVGMTMMVLISVWRDIRVPSIPHFSKQQQKLPHQRCPRRRPRSVLSSGRKGWIDRIVMAQWQREPRAIKALPNGRKRVLFIDNFSGHNLTDNIKQALADPLISGSGK